MSGIGEEVAKGFDETKYRNTFHIVRRNLLELAKRNLSNDDVRGTCAELIQLIEDNIKLGPVE
jgi:hypothetical protein